MEKKTVFISGCSRGIGNACMLLFAKRGWNIVAHSRQQSEEYERYIQKLSSENDIQITPVYFDMRDELAMKEQVKSVISGNKIRLDAIINNAGVCDIKLFIMTTVDTIRDVFDVNLFSHMKLTQLLIKRMGDGGSIVNIASIDGLKPNMGETAYASSKAAMIAWTKVLGKEFAGKIRVNAVAPYAVNTDLAQNIKDQSGWNEEDLLEPESVASAVYYLASDESSDITGEVLEVAGKQI